MKLQINYAICLVLCLQQQGKVDDGWESDFYQVQTVPGNQVLQRISTHMTSIYLADKSFVKFVYIGLYGGSHVGGQVSGLKPVFPYNTIEKV